MRKCIRCGTDMKENYGIKVQSGGYGIEITNGTKIFSERIGKPQIAICPKCGELSIYIDTEKVIQ